MALRVPYSWLKDYVPLSLTPAQLAMLLEGIDWRRPARSAAPQMAV